jgi:DNA helicase-2/ATP-dependent DNA helicase PcrA
MPIVKRTLQAPPISVPVSGTVSLDPDQFIVADFAVGEAVVAAAAGSGKSTTLVEWVARRINSGADPSRIFIVAYNSSAGADLKLRLAERLGEPISKRIYAGTIHGMCWKLWKEAHEGDPRGRPENVIGTDRCEITSYQLLAAAYKAADWFCDIENKDVLTLSERVRESGVAVPGTLAQPKIELVEHFRKAGGDGQANDYARAAQLYELEKGKRSLIDFTDMMLNVSLAVRRAEPWVMKLQGRFQFLALDEAQDANALQVGILEHLAVGSICNLWVGDFRQSIYSFRGARPDLLRVRIDSGAAKLLSMRFNHRSGSAIVAASNRFASGADWHIGGDSLSDPSNGLGSVTVSSDVDVVGEIVAAVGSGEPAGSIGYVARTNAELAGLEASLALAKVPYHSTAGGGGVWKGKDARGFAAYLRATKGKATVDELCSIANRPVRMLSRKVLERVFGVSARLSDPAGALHAEHYRPATKFAEDLWDVAGAESWTKACEVVAELLKEDVRARTSKDVDADEDRLGLIESICSIVSGTGSLDGFEHLLAEAEKAASNKAENSVLLSTVHKMKGGQRETIYVAAGLMPHPLVDGDDLGEEERIYYVAITRARRKLVVVADPSSHIFARRHAVRGPTLGPSEDPERDEDFDDELEGDLETSGLLDGNAPDNVLMLNDLIDGKHLMVESPPDPPPVEAARTGDVLVEATGGGSIHYTPGLNVQVLPRDPNRIPSEVRLVDQDNRPIEDGPDEVVGPRAVVVRLTAMRSLLAPFGFIASVDERSRQYVFDGPPPCGCLEDPCSLAESFVVRVYTSIAPGQLEARGIGQDSMKVVVLHRDTLRPACGKGAIVARTKNWRENLLRRINEQVGKAK